MDNEGGVWVKSGADKRKATSREEIQRMYQAAGLLHADEVPVPAMPVSEVDRLRFSQFYEDHFGEPWDESELNAQQVFENLNLEKNGVMNIAGALLFGRKPHLKLPAFIAKCVAFPGNDVDADEYYDSQDVGGCLQDLFDGALGFVLRNLRRVQGDGDVNSLGTLEIPKITLEEILTNAFLHRDYFVSAAVRVFVFSDRVEIISPGHLPNNLTIEHIKSGNSNIRNPILASFATKLLPYRGLGSGVRRALKAYPHIQFEDDRAGNQFKVVIARVANKTA